MIVRSEELVKFQRLMEKLDEPQKQEMLHYLQTLHEEEKNPATNLTAREIIRISSHKPINEFYQAEEIAMEFRERVNLSRDPKMFIEFLRMIAAIWCGGYIAGVRAERKRHRSKDN